VSRYDKPDSFSTVKPVAVLIYFNVNFIAPSSTTECSEWALPYSVFRM